MKKQIEPTGFHTRLNEGARLLHQNRPGEALEKLLPLYKAAPDHPDVAINVGGAYVLQRKWKKAQEVLKAASKLHPKNAMIWINLGAAYLGRLETSGPRHQEQAIKAYQRALQIDSKAPNVHYHLGLIYMDRREWERSTTFFQRALEVNPADRDAQQWIDRIRQKIDEEHTKDQE